MADIDYAAWLRFALAQVGQQTELRILELFSGHAPMTALAGAVGAQTLTISTNNTPLDRKALQALSEEACRRAGTRCAERADRKAASDRLG